MVDFDVETTTKRQIKGNIYLAKVTRVEPSLQAAFVDYGGNRHGFLAFNEIHPDYYQIPVEDRVALLADEAEQAARQAELEDSAEENKANNINFNDVAPSSEISEGDENFILEIDDAKVEDTDTASLNNVERNRDEFEKEPNEEPTAGAVDVLDEVPRPRTRSRRSYKIQEVIKRRQILLIQVVKEERGNKGAALTTYLSLAGRYCVLMPNTARGGGISRKISNQPARRKLKKIVTDLDVPEGMGVIVRTAGQNRTKSEIRRDFEYLLRLWDSVRDLTLDSSAPTVVYEEADLIKRAIRDMYAKEIDEILVDGDDGYRVAKDFMRMLMPSHAKKVQPYRDRIPLLHRYQIEQQLDSMHSNVVQLKSGGYLVFGQTEALVAVDVNSGRSTKERNIEETALKTNLEAATEIGRQLRLRDLAGLVVIDFIDMDENRNNRLVERRIKEALKDDRARIQIGRISIFGLLELSRQRLRPSLFEASTKICDICSGTGFVRTIESTALHVLRAIEEEGIRGRAAKLSVHAPSDVSLYLLNQKRDHLAEFEQRYHLQVFVLGDGTLVAPEYRLTVDQTRAPKEIEAIERERKRTTSQITTDDIENDTSEQKKADSNTPEEPSEKRPRRKRRTRKRNEERKPDDTPPNSMKSGVETGEEPSNNENRTKTDASDSDKPRRRRRGRRGGRRNRASVDQASQSEQVSQPKSQNVDLREVKMDLTEENIGIEASPDLTKMSNSQNISVEENTKSSQIEPEVPLPIEDQDTINTPDPATYAKNIGAAETPNSPDLGTPSLGIHGENSTSVLSKNTDKEKEPKQEEVPVKPDTPKRRGWWQRGKLF